MGGLIWGREEVGQNGARGWGCGRVSERKEGSQEVGISVSYNFFTIFFLPFQNILASACANEAENARYGRVDGDVSSGNTGALPSAPTSVASSSHTPQHGASNSRSIERPTGDCSLKCQFIFFL